MISLHSDGAGMSTSLRFRGKALNGLMHVMRLRLSYIPKAFLVLG